MRKIIIVFALLCALSPARAQYESFFGRESWEYAAAYYVTCYTDEYDPHALGPCTETFNFSFNHDDTLNIDGNTYYSYCHDDYFNYFSIFLREDTVNGRLFARYSTDEAEDEYLLCDLSLSVGDTFVLTSGSVNWGYYEENMKMVVDSIGYPSGKKVIYLSLLDCNYWHFYNTYAAPYMTSEFNISLRFMEGVGPMYGVCPPYSWMETAGALLCLHKDNNLYYMTHETLGCFQSTCDIPLFPESSLQVYPNPTSDQVTLEFITEEEVSGTVIVRDIVGRVCRLFSVNDKKTVLDVSVLPQGVYMLTFIDQRNRRITKKFVKQ